MAEKQSYARLSQIDYCIQQYYSKYLAPDVVKTFNKADKARRQEYLDAYNIQMRLPGSGMGLTAMQRDQSAQGTANLTGAWSKKTNDDIVDMLNKAWFRDGSVRGNDLNTLYTNLLIELAKSKGYKDFSQLGSFVSKDGRPEWKWNKTGTILDNYAQIFLSRRIRSCVVETLAHRHVPRSSAEYIANKSVEESLVGLVIVGNGSNFLKRGNKGTLDSEVHDKAIEFYNPSKGENIAGLAGSLVLDNYALKPLSIIAKPAIAGIGKGISRVPHLHRVGNLSIKFGNLDKVAVKTTAKQKVIAGAKNYGLGLGSVYIFQKGIEYLTNKLPTDEKEQNKQIFNDENAEKKIHHLSSIYRKSGTSLIYDVNNQLSKNHKIKVAAPNFNLQSKLISNQLMKDAKGYSYDLQKSITKYFDHQAIPYNSKASIPGWMLNKSSKQCRALAASFYAIAKQMSEKRMDEVKIPGGKKMRLKDVAQRAYDYSRAATYIDRKTWERKAEQERRSIPRHRGYGHSHNQSQKVFREQPEEVIMDRGRQTGASYTTSSSNQDIKQQQPMDSQYQQFQPSIKGENLAGWQKGLEDNGLGDFTSLGKNLGYVLAMLPDMLIGLFTGKNPNFKLDDNYMQLGALMMAFFMRKRSPMIALLLGGLGGASLLSNVNKGLQTQEQKEAAKKKQFKRYPDEPLNPRIQSPILKGRSLLCTIDGKPMSVTINNDEPVYCVEKGIIPINTFANRVLQIIDEQKNQSSQNYDRHIGEENQEQQGMKLK